MNNTFKSSFLKNHVAVLIIFFGLTLLFTYPAIFNPNEVPGGMPRDLMGYVWSMWWYDEAIKDPDLSIFSTTSLRYPYTTEITAVSPFASFISIPLQTIWEPIDTYKIILYSTFVLTGYTTFLLAYYVTKNYPAAIIAGIIFNFNVYHLIHAQAHLGLVILFWIPLFVLFFLKTKDTNKLKFPILAGISLFLVFLSHWYFAFFSLFLAGVLVVYFLIEQRNNKFILKMGVLFGVFFVLMIPFVYVSVFQYFDSGGSGIRTIDEMKRLSADLTDYFRFSPESFLVKNSPISLKAVNPIFEGWLFLGFTTIGLAATAIIKYQKKNTLLWIILALFFILVSLGPYLKINGISTPIPLPVLAFAELPIFNIFRAVARAGIFAVLPISILASMGLAYILSKRKSVLIKSLIFSSVAVVLILELLILPFPSFEVSIPEIYYEIANEKESFVVLETPLGGNGDLRLTGDHLFWYYATIHEKPIINAGMMRTPHSIQREIQTNFLNKFIGTTVELPTANEVVKQDLSEVGVSLLNYYDIGWVIIHKERSDFILKQRIWHVFVPKTTEFLEDILDKKPNYEDSQVIAFKIPKSTSNTPFIVLGDGWSPLNTELRSIGKDATIILINPTKEKIMTNLTLDFSAFVNPRIVEFEFSDKIVESIHPEEWKRVIMELELMPGENVFQITSDSFDLDDPLSVFEPPLEKSLIFKKISLTPDSNNDNSIIIELTEEEKARIEIFRIYNELLLRDPEPLGLETFTNYLLSGKSIQWVEDKIKLSNEYQGLRN